MSTEPEVIEYYGHGHYLDVTIETPNPVTTDEQEEYLDRWFEENVQTEASWVERYPINDARTEWLYRFEAHP